jgi:hypothetical protein
MQSVFFNEIYFPGISKKKDPPIKKNIHANYPRIQRMNVSSQYYEDYEKKSFLNPQYIAIDMSLRTYKEQMQSLIVPIM